MSRRLFAVLVLALGTPLPQLEIASAQVGPDPPVFRTAVRLVEVFATVTDKKGRYISGLSREQFRILDNGVAQQITTFETEHAGLSIALVLDVTESMKKVLPRVKNAMVRTIDQMRPDDSVAVYAFRNSLEQLQEFTRDKSQAKRAVLRTRAEGVTALFDVMSSIAGDLAKRNGKKIMLVFTDGADTASVLNAESAVRRAKRIGVPIYAIAQGDAINSRLLLNQLDELTSATGGLTYKVRDVGKMDRVFDDITRHMQNTYLLGFQPRPAGDEDWRVLHLSVLGVKNYRIRAREGYFLE